jgi:hypothetical protein
MPPGEVHDGIAGANQPYTLQTFRLSPVLLGGFGKEITGRHYFPSQAAAVIEDSRLADQLLKMHSALRHGRTDQMLNESIVLELLQWLFARLKQPAPQRITENLSVQQLRIVRDFVEVILPTKSFLNTSHSNRPGSVPFPETVPANHWNDPARMAITIAAREGRGHDQRKPDHRMTTFSFLDDSAKVHIPTSSERSRNQTMFNKRPTAMTLTRPKQ